MSKDIIDRIGADRIIEVCNSSNTFKEACEKLGCGYRYLVSASTKLGCFAQLNQRSKENSHRNLLSNQPWRIKTDSGYGAASYITDHKIWCEYLFSGQINTSAARIKKHLILAGFKENKCECCGITDWNNLPISLQLHHIDGDPSNNILSNLQILCPNCHSQTENYGSKNAKNREKNATYSVKETGSTVNALS